MTPLERAARVNATFDPKEAVRAVLTALREPGEAMLDAGLEAIQGCYEQGEPDIAADGAWQNHDRRCTGGGGVMAWGPFSAEAVLLDSKLRGLHKEGRVAEAIGEIEEALARAHREGPSNLSYQDFERAADPGPA